MHQCAITSIECTQALLQATTNGWMIGAQVNKGEHNRTCIRSPLGDNGERYGARSCRAAYAPYPVGASSVASEHAPLL